MLVLLMITAFYTWTQVFAGKMMVSAFLLPAVIVGLIVGFVIIFKKKWSPYLAPVYALVEGVFLGAISAFFELAYPNIVIQAVLLTFGVLFALLLVYKSKLIKVTQNFRLGVVAATGGIVIIYLLTWILSFFNISIPYIHDASPIGIGFSVLVIVIAALNLVLDFDFIERASEKNVPKYMEWYGAFGLIVTLIWLYLEMLRLLSKIRSR